MAKFVGNPVLVDAFVITDVDYAMVEGPHVKEEEQPSRLGLWMKTEDGKDRFADTDMLARITPVAGDYWVIQSDGYEYLNPKAVFERKYSPASPSTGTV